MCGATSDEKSAEQSEKTISGQMDSSFANIFGTNSSIGASIKSAMTPIISAGLGQQGFAPAETAAEKANIMDQGAADAGFAANSVNEKMAQSGQTNPSAVAGVDAQIAQRGQQETATAENNFDVANMEQGEKNFFGASAALPAEEATLENATSAAGGAADSAASAEMQGAQDIQQANDAWIAPVAGMIGGLGGAAITGEMQKNK
jgi:hypothetical protein